jgi:hypothetical protein
MLMLLLMQQQQQLLLQIQFVELNANEPGCC